MPLLILHHHARAFPAAQSGAVRAAGGRAFLTTSRNQSRSTACLGAAGTCRQPHRERPERPEPVRCGQRLRSRGRGWRSPARVSRRAGRTSTERRGATLWDAEGAAEHDDGEDFAADEVVVDEEVAGCDAGGDGRRQTRADAAQGETGEE